MIRIIRSTLTKTSNCVDIGAHQGEFLKHYIALAPQGHHFAFEPLPEFASSLRKNFPAVTVYNCALGNRTERTTFCHALNMPGWSGLKTQPYPVECSVDEIEVDVMTLDDTIPSDVRIEFIKIDVEGAELEVLEGARETIKQYRPVVLFEHAKIHNLEYNTTPESIYDLLAGEYHLSIRSLDGTGPLSKEELVDIYYTSFDSNYDRNAQTNFVAG